ncbi:MAG: hypothetical protein ACKOQ4_06625 [Mycobacterium sp.]
MKVGRKPGTRAGADDASNRVGAPARSRRGEKGSAPRRRSADSPGRSRAGTRTRPQEARSPRQGPQSAPAARPADRPARPKSSSQAKARAKARKAKAPKAIRPPLRDRLLIKLAAVELSPRALIARIPFVVLVIAALALGLGITLWLSTDAAQRSYQLGSARALNDALVQQKEALERDVLEAESAPALADAARNLGMIPSRDTAHLVLDPAGNWVVVGQPKPAEGASPPPLNTKLPEEKPPAPTPAGPPVAPAVKPAPGAEIPARTVPAAAGPEVPVLVPVTPAPLTAHNPAGAPPGQAPLPGPAPGPLLAAPGVPPVPALTTAPGPIAPAVPPAAAPLVPAGPGVVQ